MKIFHFLFIVFFTFSAFCQQSMEYLSWEEVKEMCLTLKRKCDQHRSSWKGLLIVTRGGLVPGAFLSQFMNIKTIRVIGVASYAHAKQGKLKKFYHPQDITDGGKGWLVVDEICDTGETLKYIRTLYPHAFYASMVVKPKGKRQVDVYASESDQDTFIVFPWEKESA